MRRIHHCRPAATTAFFAALLTAIVATLFAIAPATAQAASAQCNGLTATIVGTDGPDVLWGTNNADIIAAGDGDDRINGLGGDDIICGGAGADRIYAGAGDDTVFGRSGSDKIRGGSGDDNLLGGAGPDFLKGGAGNDTLAGQDGTDRLRGGTGDDTLTGADGHDLIWGGPGTDELDGGPGDDTLNGGSDDDQCADVTGIITVVACEGSSARGFVFDTTDNGYVFTNTPYRRAFTVGVCASAPQPTTVRGPAPAAVTETVVYLNQVYRGAVVLPPVSGRYIVEVRCEGIDEPLIVRAAIDHVATPPDVSFTAPIAEVPIGDHVAFRGPECQGTVRLHDESAATQGSMFGDDDFMVVSGDDWNNGAQPGGFDYTVPRGTAIGGHLVTFACYVNGLSVFPRMGTLVGICT